MFDPVIKWSGSKRSQANDIIKFFPRKIKSYYEPFVGGGSVVRQLLDTDIEVEKYVCSDINKDLINTWNEIKNNPEFLCSEYEKMWKELNLDDDLERKKKYFEFVRTRYNTTHKPEDFLFIMRTTTNGMPRYNSKGQFNNSFHVTRNGIIPAKLYKIILEWSELLKLKEVEFVHQSYENIYTENNDIIYLDPPYFGTKGMYCGRINYENFWNWLRQQRGLYFLSFDGKVNQEDFTHSVPHDTYSKHEYLRSGNSSFRRVIGKSKDSIVYESLYIK